MTQALICQGPGPTLRVVDVCDGATATGGCPRVGAGEPVRCAGLRVLVEGPGTAPFVFAVAEDARACPVALLGLLPATKRPPGADAPRKEHGHDHN